MPKLCTIKPKGTGWSVFFATQPEGASFSGGEIREFPTLEAATAAVNEYLNPTAL